MMMDFILIVVLSFIDFIAPWQDLQGSLSLTRLFLIWLIYRASTQRVLVAIFCSVILTLPFTEVPFLRGLVGYLLVFFVVKMIRVQFYTEAYLTLALWTSFISLALSLVLHLFAYGPSVVLGGSLDWIYLLRASLISGFISVPFYLVLDQLFDSEWLAYSGRL